MLLLRWRAFRMMMKWFRHAFESSRSVAKDGTGNDPSTLDPRMRYDLQSEGAGCLMIDTRRSFLGGLTGVVVGGLTYPVSAATSTKNLRPLMATVVAGSDAYWQVVAEQFPVRHGKIMMNAANLCPSPRTVSEQVAQLTRDEDSDVSFPNRAKFDDLLQQSRTKVAGLINVSPEEVV